MRIRPARLDDAAELAAIYNVEVETSTVTFDLVARTVEEQRSWIQERSGAHVVLVAEVGGQVVGFASTSPYRDRPAYRTSVETSVYVRRDHHGRGVGYGLLQSLIDAARGRGFHALFARIVGGHTGSIRLHERCGYELVGVEREVGRKFGQWLDVALLQRLL